MHGLNPEFNSAQVNHLYKDTFFTDLTLVKTLICQKSITTIRSRSLIGIQYMIKDNTIKEKTNVEVLFLNFIHLTLKSSVPAPFNKLIII